MKIVFVGGGNLATALVAGLIGAGRRDLSIHVVDRNADKRAALAEKYGVTTHTALDLELTRARLIVLAVKPDGVSALAHELGAQLTDQVVVSVAAGIRTRALVQWLGGHEQVVWAMPNTPALVGRALTGLYAGAAVSAADRLLVQGVFDAVGATHWLADESMMDALTAISGCGPAYVCMFVEALDKAARRLGFDAATAAKLAEHTLFGASGLLERSGEGPRKLRERITTPRGVTEQALVSLRNSDLDEMVARAAESACRKSHAFGAQYKPQAARLAEERLQFATDATRRDA
jgi:pyrroline-5-carboxylate reductase